MKTLLVTLEYPPQIGGVANYYGSLAEYWPDSELLVLDNSKRELRGWKKSFFSIAKTLFAHDIKYIIVGHILPLGTAVYVLSKFFNFKYAVFLHGLDFSLAKRKGFISKKILSGADKIICANSRTKTEVVSFLQSDHNVFVVNPGVAEAPYIDALTRESFLVKYGYLFNDDKFNLLSLGRLVERKGFDKVIEALQLMPIAELNSINYIIAGRGEDETRLKDLALRANKIFGRELIRFIGGLSEAEKHLLLELSSVFIMPAREIAGDYEGFGIVYLEANLAHLPVIAGNSGGVGDAVENNVSGVLVDPNSARAIANAILKLKTDKNLSDKLIKSAYRRAKIDFSARTLIKRVYDICHYSRL